jgi:photosystem II stability/assembly factor-like uncharacterized protein
MRRHLASMALMAFLAVPVANAQAQLTTPLDESTLSAFMWRSVGPANMSGRVTDVEGIPSPSKTFFFAGAAGGIWKTTNNGITFRPLFTSERVVAMGDLAIAPSDTMQIWAGTGEEDSRNSISPGGGIYKSMDGGLTWELKGLEETQVIARIIVHPTNPDRVWVAALGHIWDSNPERGIYRTDDGGDSWRLVKYVSDEAGFVDLVIHPDDPNTLFASSWERVRGPYFLQSGGPGSGLWKTTDGGDSWNRLQPEGFPDGMLGRIGLDISRSNPEVIYALVEAEGTEDDSAPNGLYRTTDGGSTFEKMNTNNVRPFYYSQVRVDPKDPDRVYWSSTPVNVSTDGGATVGQTTVGLHVDHHAMWIDPNDPERIVVGNDGGVGITFDQGGNWLFPNTMALGQFYEVSYGMEMPYTVCGGLQDNGSWCGPSRRQRGDINNHMWVNVGGGDGFYTLQDPLDHEIIYSESQGGSMGRRNTATGDQMSFSKPNWKEEWLRWEDSILAKPDASDSEIRYFREMQAADSAKSELRWNWNTPLVLSPYDNTVVYVAANRVVKYTNRGEDFEVISPDLTYADAEKIRISTETTGGITPDVTGAETFATIVALAESPLQQGFLLAGTDDGRAWLSRDDGADWEELTGRFPGVPEGTWIARMEPSSHDVNTFFVAFDGHRTNDFTPYVYMTEDGGRSFTSIASDLPTGKPDFLHVVRQDLVNPNLLFVGTDLGVYVSTDMGGHWQKFMNGLPTVPVHDLKIHPRDHELIAGTHGRSIMIVDIAPLQQLDDAVLASDIHLFAPKPSYQYGDEPTGGESTGQMVFEASSPSYGAEIAYRISEDAEIPQPEPTAEAQGQRPQGPPAGRPGGRGGRQGGQQGGGGAQVELTIMDSNGETLTTLNGPATPGIHRVYWNFRGQAPEAAAKTPAQLQDSIQGVEKIHEMVDSLAEAGTMERPMLERVAESMISGNRQGLMGMFGGRGGGGGGGEPGEFNERPGETFGGGGGGGMPPGMIQVFRAFSRATGGGGRMGRGGGAQAPLAEAGEYTVVMKVGDQEFTQTFTVAKGPGADAGGGFFEELW